MVESVIEEPPDVAGAVGEATAVSHRRSFAVFPAWIYVIGRNAARALAHAVVTARDAECRASRPGFPGPAREIGDRAMDSPLVSRQAIDPGRRGCLVEGCPCKDARIVSQRRAAFFAAWAREHGETADRTIVVELGWRIPTATSSAA
jgi:hypothetical protein